MFPTNSPVLAFSLRAAAMTGSLVLLALLGANEAQAQANDLVCNACVDTGDLAPNAVRNQKIVNAAVNTAKLANNAATVAKIANSAIASAKLGANAATSAKIAPNAVNSLKIPDAAVTAAKLAPSAVNRTKVADGAVTFDKLAAGLLATHVLQVNADGTASENCDDLHSGLLEAGAIAGIGQKVVVQLDAGIFDCGTSPVVVPAHVTLRGAGQEETEITGTLEGVGDPIALVNLSSFSALEHLSVRNDRTAEGGDSFAVGDVSGATPPLALRHVNVEAKTSSGNVIGIFLSRLECPGTCLPLRLSAVKATADTAAGVESSGGHFKTLSGSVLIDVENSELRATGLTDSASGLLQRSGTALNVMNSRVEGEDFSVLRVSGAGPARVTFSRINGTSGGVTCGYVSDLAGTPAATPADCP